MVKTEIGRPTKNRSGFTLLELLVVVGILAALVALALPYYQDYVNQSKFTAAQADLQTYKKALAMYDQLEKAPYSATNDMTGLIGRYIQDFRAASDQKLPKDPWGNDYHFDVSAGSIWSSGADGVDDVTAGGNLRIAPAGKDDILITWKPEFFLATARKVNATTLELVFSRKVTSSTLLAANVKGNAGSGAASNSITPVSDTVFRAVFAATPLTPVEITTNTVQAMDGRMLLDSNKQPDNTTNANRASF